MESNPEATTPPVKEVDARSLFAAKLAALAMEKSAVENHLVKPRSAFLTRRFFGGREKQDPARTDGRPDTIEERPNFEAPQPEPPEIEPPMSARETRLEPSTTPAATGRDAAPDTLPVSPKRGELAYAPDLNPTRSGKLPPMTTLVPADAGADAPAPAIPAPAPPLHPPTRSANDFPEPRITLPSFQPSPTTMTPTENTDHPPALGQASAQLTLAFEITSLQLTPFFRLGSVQLKALSNVVSLHLAAGQQAGQGLAAGISFRIARVELDDAGHLKSLLLKPLGESREVPAPLSRLQVDSVGITGPGEDAPISVTTSGAASTAVQLVGTFAIASLEFSPAFEIDTLRLDPVSNTVLLRVAPSAGPGAQDLPSSFEIAEVQLGDGAQIQGARLVPSTGGNA